MMRVVGTPQLLLCRGVSGVGVSMLSTAAVLYVSDIRCAASRLSVGLPGTSGTRAVRA
jgi:hypothetical protein